MARATAAGDAEILEPEMPQGMIDAARFARLVTGRIGRAEIASRSAMTRSSVARQSAIWSKCSTNQRNDCCTWLKAPITIISPPNDRPPPK